MMFSGHTARNGLGDTLFLAYAAKRESEVSPGVGSGTDMFIVPQLGALMHLSADAFVPLERFYTEMKTAESAARQQATAAMAAYLTEQINRATATAQPQEGDDTPAPPQEQNALEAARAQEEPAGTPPAEVPPQEGPDAHVDNPDS